MRKDPVERGAGAREHRWMLRGADWNAAAGHVRLEWRCAHCLSDTFTQAPANVGSHGAENYLPGRRALQATWVPEDCDMALVQAVREL